MTVSTIGYGDVMMSTDYERLYASMCMLVGAAVYAYMVGAITGIVNEKGRGALEHRSMMSDLNQFLGDIHLPKRLRKEVRLYMLHTKQLRQVGGVAPGPPHPDVVGYYDPNSQPQSPV